MVDFWDDDLFWGVSLSLVMDFDLSWSIVTLDGLYWGIASSFVLIELGDCDSYGLCWDVFHFWHQEWRSIDLLICASMIFFSSCRLGCIALHWGMSIFWRGIRLVLDIGASDEWYGDHWIISCCPHCILGHSRLVGCFDIEIWLPVCDCYFWWIMELLTPWV